MLWFFTLKIVGAVTDKQRDALWLPGTAALPGLIWAPAHPGFEGMGCSDASAGARAPFCLMSMLLPKADTQQDDLWHVLVRAAQHTLGRWELGRHCLVPKPTLLSGAPIGKPQQSTSRTP